MQRLFIFSLLLFTTFFSAAAAQQTPAIKVGDPIPAFNLPYATKDSLNFEGIGSETMKGKRYLVAFFPAAWSPGCTKEVCTFRDAMTDLESLKVEILAISGDYIFTLHEWAKFHNLNFKLLADQTRQFGKTMGVYNEQSGMFRRSVFLVEPDGKISFINFNYSVTDQKDFDALKEFLAKEPK